MSCRVRPYLQKKWEMKGREEGERMGCQGRGEARGGKERYRKREREVGEGERGRRRKGCGDGIEMKARWSNSLADELKMTGKQEVWGIRLS